MKTTKKRLEMNKIANQDENPNSIKSPTRFETQNRFKPLDRTLKPDEINMQQLQMQKKKVKALIYLHPSPVAESPLIS